eukprot:TRINITY_DN8472_c0_g1_i1.p1 TRINITY_DN8472_c0_g1~~TRINITY_DN8472_c0_g1_i1.p1  ORF type:complete len:116 (+),score=20.32 TRINITY_DN8472_c0_g1_i1:297-644(+)
MILKKYIFNKNKHLIYFLVIEITGIGAFLGLKTLILCVEVTDFLFIAFLIIESLTFLDNVQIGNSLSIISNSSFSFNNLQSFSQFPFNLMNFFISFSLFIEFLREILQHWNITFM